MKEDTQQRIAELEAEVTRLKRIARCPHNPRPGLGGIIQRAREEKGMAMGKLAAKAGISKGRLSFVENHDHANVTVKMLLTIADALEVPAHVLVLRLETEPRQNINAVPQGEETTTL